MTVTCAKCGRIGAARIDSERYARVVWEPRQAGYFVKRGEDVSSYALVADLRAGRLSCGYHGEVGRE